MTAILLGGAAVSALTLTSVSRADATAGRSTPADTSVTLPQHTPDPGQPPVPYVSIDFSNSQLYASEYTVPNSNADQVIWQAGVKDTSPLTFSAQTSVAEHAGWWLPFFRPPFSFQAARGAVVAAGVSPFGEPYEWRLLDRGVVTRTLSIARPEGFSDKENHPETSGPYTLVRGQVFRADGTLMYSIPQDAPDTSYQGDLYGTGVIWSAKDFDSRKVWYDDVSKPQSATNPLLLDSCTCSDSSPSVSIWGDTVAWTTAANRQIVVRLLGSTATRLVPADDGASVICLGEGTLAWSGGWALDLTSAKSTPVQLAGMASDNNADPKLDGHLMAAIAGGQVKVARLPFGRKYRPRLLGVLAPSTLAANDVWSPQFDTTKALTDVRLQITSAAGRAVRTLSGTGPEGSIRDLTWDGRTYGNRALPPGLYHWQLQARAADGEGALIGVDGGQIQGTVQLT